MECFEKTRLYAKITLYNNCVIDISLRSVPGVIFYVSLNFGDKIWVYAQIKLDRIHQVGMTYVICEGGILGLYRYAFTIFEKKN